MTLTVGDVESFHEQKQDRNICYISHLCLFLSQTDSEKLARAFTSSSFDYVNAQFESLNKSGNINILSEYWTHSTGSQFNTEFVD